MKIFTKICLIAAAIAAGLGIIAVVVGLGLGANVKDLAQMGIYVSPDQKLVVNGITVNGFRNKKQERYGVGNRQGNGRLSAPDTSDMQCYSCSLQKIHKLEVEVQNARITILETADTEELIYCSNQNIKIDKEDGSTLKLEDNSSLQEKMELVLHIPVGVLDEIEIEAVNGTIEADILSAEKVSIEIDNASVEIKELFAKEEAKLQINAGQMVIGYYAGNQLETECAMGSIKVVCEGNPTDYNFDLECGMGNIQIQEDNYSGIGNDLKIHNESEKSIKAECAMGEVILEFPNSL